MHGGALIGTIVGGLVLAFILGAIAHRLRISPLVAYLLAGVAVGPFTPGFVANQELANELAEIGVVLLMFGVGLHFSINDLMSVRRIAVPGAIAQIAAAALLGFVFGELLGWSIGGGLVFGLALSVASTVVLLRALQDRRLLDTGRGRIAVGWLVVEDLATVLALVLLPAFADVLAGGSGAGSVHLPRPLGGDLTLNFWGVLALTLGKVVAFIALMLVVGRRVVPGILHWAAHTGSRELFRLAVLAVALGVAFGAAILFGVSFALGAFFAGMILSESKLSQRAAEETLPLRDAFAVLFFISVGMLFNPRIIVEAPLQLAGTLFIIVVGKSVAAYVIVRLFGHPKGTALTIAASLAQIGEFSFILAAMGVDLGILPPLGRDLILGGAIISILLNPLLFAALDRFSTREAAKAAAAQAAAAPAGDAETSAGDATQASTESPSGTSAVADPQPEDADSDLVTSSLTGHTVLVGYGRVGSLVGAGLRDAKSPFLVVEDADSAVSAARADGAEVIVGNAADPAILAATNLSAAQRLLVAIPQSFEAGQVVQQARSGNPELEIIARAHSDAEVEHLEKCGATRTIMGEREIARGMLRLVLDKEPSVSVAS